MFTTLLEVSYPSKEAEVESEPTTVNSRKNLLLVVSSDTDTMWGNDRGIIKGLTINIFG